ncbi:MAG: hypothetical protein SVV03_00405, partial [Candidatus Nanohaloarchaea archaeon]|nr:hypothetical protein [Candidatus Nanohaloarchaea archaeon]
RNNSIAPITGTFRRSQTASGNAYMWILGSIGGATGNLTNSNWNGKTVWNQTYSSGNGRDNFRAVAQDSEFLYLAGYYSNSNSNDDWILEKRYKQNKSLVWDYKYGTTGGDRIQDIVVNGSNQIYAGGFKQDGVWRLEKLNSTGESQWVHTFNNTDNREVLHEMTIGSDGGLYLGGAYYTSSGDRNRRVEKLDNSGSSQWVYTFGTSNRDRVRGIASDDSGGIYTVGDGNYSGGSTAKWQVRKLNTAGDMEL